MPYPKAGTPNPTVQVTVVKLADTHSSFKVPAPLSVTNDHLVMKATWAESSDLLAVLWMNRIQNKAVITLCKASLAVDPCREFYEYQSDAWLDSVPLVFSPSGRYLAMLLSHLNYTHIALLNTEDETGDPDYITSGSFVVTSLLKFSADDAVVYYVSTELEESVIRPRQRHLWSVGTAESNIRHCLSCSTPCKYSTASFSNSGEFYMLSCTGPDVPSYTLHDIYTDEVTVLEDNQELKSRLEDYMLPRTIYFSIDSDSVSEGFEVAFLLPPNFSKGGKYAVLFEVYGGPGSQKVSQTFYLDWRTYLVSNFDIIVIMLDGRGTGYRGDKFMHAVYRQLGRFETDDIIEGARKLKSMFNFLDPNKFSIWGRSYGGYLASMVAGSGSKEFQAAIGEAPVTAWIYYNSVYTERYNGLPFADDNLENYEKYNVMSRADNFSDIEYLLVHGTGDDNVHFQNAAQLVRALTVADIRYQVQFYTDANHALEDEVTKRHLLRLKTDFLIDKLNLTVS
jgi:dipeptidyl aminopeptidase/acylaminoacyl peptidase